MHRGLLNAVFCGAIVVAAPVRADDVREAAGLFERDASPIPPAPVAADAAPTGSPPWAFERARAMQTGGADPAPAAAGGSDDLAKQLANPIAALISIPFQLNYDQGQGPDEDGGVWLLNVQPVIPITLNCDWNVISRTIVPIVQQDDMFPGDDGVFGLGDVLQSAFFSPKRPTAGGLVWGAGPVVLFPTATDDRLGREQWAAGPTVVGLVQERGWTVGLLANHLWSFAGDDDRPDVNATFVQPFVSYTTKTAWTFSLNTESTYDWEAAQWSVPVNVAASKLLKIGCQPVSVGVGVRYWAEAPDDGPEGFGLRFIFTILLPKK